MQQAIIDFIKEHNLSATDVADALGKTGLLSTARPLTPGSTAVGRGYYVYACNNSNWTIHRMIQHAPEGSVVFAAVYYCGDNAVLGDLTAIYALKRGVIAIVVDGLVRDAHCIVSEGMPVWCKGVSPIGCGHDDTDLDAMTARDSAALAQRVNNSILVCDESGVVMIESAQQNDLLRKLEAVRMREEKWHKAISGGSSTYDVVCLGKY